MLRRPPGPSWLALLAIACTDPTDDPIVDASVPPDAAADVAAGDGPPAAPFTIVVLPDTQFYAQAYPEIFKAQTDWILAHREDQRIAFVLHEGDIVNFDFDEQWAVAAQNLHTLDGKVPYVLAAGNHDLSWKGGRLGRDADLMNHYFPASALAALPWPTGTFEPGKIESHYQVLEAGGGRWLVLSLEYGPRDAVVEWADQVLTQYADLPAIVLTHAYLSDIFGRYNRTNKQPFWPCGDRMDLGGCNDGEDLWRKALSRHDNVMFVFSGHVLHPGAGRLTSDHPSGRRTHQMLANYQTCADVPCKNPVTGKMTQGGDGFLRLVRIDPAARTATVETYSPYLDEWKTDDAHKFVLPLDPQPFAPLAAAPLPRARAPLSRPQPSCDGVQVILEGVEAIGTATSARRVRACLDGACESFTIEPDSLRCLPGRAQSRVSCANDEGMLRLFFFERLSARQRITVSAEDGQGQRIFAAERMITARRDGRCWTAVQPLRGP
jgi:3',5'-cyclic AMP phosphodiesterase CpdA